METSDSPKYNYRGGQTGGIPNLAWVDSLLPQLSNADRNASGLVCRELDRINRGRDMEISSAFIKKKGIENWTQSLKFGKKQVPPFVSVVPLGKLLGKSAEVKLTRKRKLSMVINGQSRALRSLPLKRAKRVRLVALRRRFPAVEVESVGGTKRVLADSRTQEAILGGQAAGTQPRRLVFERNLPEEAPIPNVPAWDV